MKKKTTKTAKKVVKNKKPLLNEDYSASIKSMGITETVVGTSISDVIGRISNLRIKKGMAVLTIFHSGASKERVLNRLQIMRLFNANPSVKETAIAQISSLYNL